MRYYGITAPVFLSLQHGHLSFALLGSVQRRDCFAQLISQPHHLIAKSVGNCREANGRRSRYGGLVDVFVAGRDASRIFASGRRFAVSPKFTPCRKLALGRKRTLGWKTALGRRLASGRMILLRLKFSPGRWFASSRWFASGWFALGWFGPGYFSRGNDFCIRVFIGRRRDDGGRQIRRRQQKHQLPVSAHKCVDNDCIDVSIGTNCRRSCNITLWVRASRLLLIRQDFPTRHLQCRNDPHCNWFV